MDDHKSEIADLGMKPNHAVQDEMGCNGFRKPKVVLLLYVESAEINEPRMEVTWIQPI